jgi:copper chaperone CopZ
MKNIFLVICCLWALTSQAQVQKVNLQASGLTCAMCSKAIYKAVSALSFVDTVIVDIEASTYELRFKKEATPRFDQIAKAVVDAGFSVAKLSADIKFDKQAVDKNGETELDGIRYKIVASAPGILQGTKKIQFVGKPYMLPKDFKKIAQVNTAGVDAKTYLVMIK